jgi:hypothetical protein
MNEWMEMRISGWMNGKLFLKFSEENIRYESQIQHRFQRFSVYDSWVPNTEWDTVMTPCIRALLHRLELAFDVIDHVFNAVNTCLNIKVRKLHTRDRLRWPVIEATQIYNKKRTWISFHRMFGVHYNITSSLYGCCEQSRSTRTARVTL